MVTKQTTNPETKVAPNVTPADMLRRIVQLGKAARTAALDLCYSCACYILLVNHFTDANTKGFMARGDAVEFLRKKLKEDAGIEGGMLDIYIRNASTLAGMVSSSPTIFADVLKRLSAADVDAMVPILANWMETNYASKSYRGKLDSLRTLSEALGYSTGRAAVGGGALTAAKVGDRIDNTIKQIEKVVKEGDKSGSKVSAGSVAKAIVGAVAEQGGADQSVILAREAIGHIWNVTILQGLAKTVDDQIKKARDMAKRAEAEVKAQTGTNKQPKPRKTKSTTVRTQV